MVRVLACLTAEHNWRLLLVAAIACLLASLAAVGLLRRARAARGRARAAWIMTTGAAAGAGIWATHFIATLAYDPGFPVAYDVGLTALALLAAVSVTTAGVACAVDGRAAWAPAAGGALIGAAMGSTHHLGLWALRLPAHAMLSLDLVIASLVLGMAFGAAALTLALRRSDAPTGLAAAMLLALAVTAHHFIAMGAVATDLAGAADALALSPLALAVAAAAGTAVLVGLCLVAVLAGRRADDLLREQNLRLDGALNNMCQGLCMFDAEGRLVVANERYGEMYDLPKDLLTPGRSLHALLHARVAHGTFSGDVDRYVEELSRTIAAGRTSSTVVELDDGRVIEVINQPMAGSGWVATHEDITEKRRSQQALQETRDLLNTVIENVPATLVVKDVQTGRYVLVNRAGEELFGLPREEMIGKTTREVFCGQEPEGIAARDAEVARSGRQLVIEEHPLETPRRGTRFANVKRLPLLDPSGTPKYLLTVIEDITERKRAEARIAHLAHHDTLTNLPNRAAFNECLAATLERAAAGGEQFAVMCLDFDRFKEVNDVFGHGAGDALLQEVARRLQAAVEGAFLARVGGDEFMVIAAGPQPATAGQLAERIHAAIEPEIAVAGQALRIGITVGVAIFPSDGRDATALVGNADAALYRAKSEARGSLRFFEAEMDRRLRDRRALQHDLRAALARDEFELHYQPQALIGGEIVGFEALVRWIHPTRGIVSPAAFIPVAEESGLIIQLGEWILRQACREAANWPRPLQIAINLSPVQFQHGDLVALVHAVLLETGLAANRLELEITEGVLIGDFSRALSILRRLKAMGVRIAMDDFGTGYSSLSYLQSFPFDKIKIDQAFIANLDTNPQSAAIIRAVIGLGRGLDLPVVAEGVETQAQLAFLSQEACDEVQGYLVGRPWPIENYAEIVGRPKPPLSAVG